MTGRIGLALAEMKRTPEAIAMHEAALAQAETLGDQRLAGEQQIMLAFLWRDTNEMEKAMTLCQAALTSFEACGDAAAADNARALLIELGG